MAGANGWENEDSQVLRGLEKRVASQTAALERIADALERLVDNGELADRYPREVRVLTR